MNYKIKEKFSFFFMRYLESNKLKIFAVVSLVIVIVFIYCLRCHNKYEGSYKSLGKAYVAFNHGDHEAGIAFLDDTISKFSKTPAAHHARLIKADILIDLGNYSEALKILKEVLNDGGNSGVLKPLANVRIIYIYDMKKDYFNAIVFSKKFIEKYPNHFLVKDIYLNLAEYCFISGSSSEALKILKEIIVNFPATKEAEKAQSRLDSCK
ncbi:MAG: tetratricopeptide repeat protein [Endomicrobium sp.]|jgi:tetratricopeptide (TPR) repeat protein|nr:tetratricopeptide repeat protein [Endomicrobium sp.]